MSYLRFKDNKKKILIITSVILVILVIFSASFLLKNNSISTNTSIIKDSDLIINTNDISPSAKFYPVEIEGTKMEVLAIKAPDGSIRTAFNTCQVCYSSGKGYYVQKGSNLICQNCGNSFRASDVELTKGGCNPVPILPKDKTVTNGTITITKAYLIQAKNIFSNWKTNT